MSTYYTSEGLIESVKRRISIPTNQNTYTDTNILQFADEELMLSVVPAIMTLHQDYLLYSDEIQLEQNKNEYKIPYRAVGNKLYDLQYKDQNNNIIPMSRTTEADRFSYNGFYTSNGTYAYYVKNNRVILMSQVTSNDMGSLVFIYYIRPSSLVFTPEVMVVSNIDRSTGIITVNKVPATFSTSTKCDFYEFKSPHTIMTIDKIPTAVNATQNNVTFNPNDIPDELEVGDHISLAQQCAIPQIPSDLHVFLAQKTAERILEAQGDLDGLKLAQSKSAEMEVRAGTIIDNRVEESPIKLVNRNGILQSGLIRRNWRRRT